MRCLAVVLLWAVRMSISGAEETVPAAAANTLGMEFVRVQPGEYTRGFDTSNQADHRFALAHRYSTRQTFADETPPHRVLIASAFELAETEVTVGQFQAFVDASNYITDAEKTGGALGCFPDEANYVDRFHKAADITWRSPGFKQSSRHPVVAVSWHDAQAFCRWLASQEPGVRYRLPTEAEWEYACRAGSTTWYSWGEDPDEAYQHANVADGALEATQPGTTRFQRAIKLQANEGDGFVFTAPASNFQPNPWGLYDLHGNVWEWCQDRWKADVYRDLIAGVPRQEQGNLLLRDPLQDAETPQHQYGDWRVIRGGAWTTAPAGVRSSIRAYAEAGDASVYTGFRVVRVVR